jgi:hypothetical protein
MLDAKRELVQAWLTKAQHDLATARKGSLSTRHRIAERGLEAGSK